MQGPNLSILLVAVLVAVDFSRRFGSLPSPSSIPETRFDGHFLWHLARETKPKSKEMNRRSLTRSKDLSRPIWLYAKAHELVLGYGESIQGRTSGRPQIELPASIPALAFVPSCPGATKSENAFFE